MATQVNTGFFGKYSLTDPVGLLMGLIGASLGITFIVIAVVFGTQAASGLLDMVNDRSPVDVDGGDSSGVSVEVV